MTSALRGVITQLHEGTPLSLPAIGELERLLDALRAEGWSGSIPADEAVEHLAARDDDRARAKPSYWLTRAAGALDCAVQTAGPPHSTEIDKLETRCDELAALLKGEGR